MTWLANKISSLRLKSKNKKSKSVLKKKKAFALSVDALLFVGVFAFASLEFSNYMNKKAIDEQISTSASDLAIVSNGVRQLISDFYLHLDALETITGFAGIATAGNTVVFNNPTFLKSKDGSCTLGNIPSAPVVIPSAAPKTVETPVNGYIPCGLETSNPFNQNYKLTFSNVAGSLSVSIKLSKVNFNVEPNRAGLIAEKIVQRSKGDFSNSSYLNSFWEVYANGSTSAVPNPADADFGKIDVVVASSGGENWLRLDGSTKMTGNIDGGDNELNNVSIISGDSVNNELQVTADTQFSGANGVYIDNGLSTNKLISRGDSLLKDTYVDGVVSSTGDISSAGKVTAKNMRITDNTIGGESLNVGNGVYYTAIVDTNGVPNVSVAKPVCSTGSARIFAVPAYPVASSGSTGYYGTYVDVTSSGASWLIKVNKKVLNSTTGNLDVQAVSGTLAKALVMTKCQ